MIHNSARDRGRAGGERSSDRKRRRWRMRPTVVVLEDRRLLSTFTVTNNASSGAGSLPYEIGLANTAGGANAIVFDSLFNTPQTITLGGTQLELSTANESVTITGPAAGVTVSGGGASRVFQVDGLVTASISGLTITGGNAGSNNGGGVQNYGSLALTSCTVSDNSASYGGGVFNNTGSLALTNCTVSGNSAGNGGGGVSSGSYEVVGSTTTLTNCTISGNSASWAGGLYTGNKWHGHADQLHRQRQLHALGRRRPELLFRHDHAGQHDRRREHGGCLRNRRRYVWCLHFSGQQPDRRYRRHLRLAQLRPDRHQRPPLNAVLAPLGNYGGPTQTMALLPGSPAIDAGNNALIPAGVTTDQRGLPRIINGAVDIGAFESEGFNFTVVPGGTPQTATIGTPFANPLAVSVTANNPLEPVNGGLVTFVANPASNGASAAFVSASSAVVANGQAAVTAAPNNADGSSTVVATSTGFSTTFDLTNAGPVFAAPDREYDEPFSLPGSRPLEPA